MSGRAVRLVRTSDGYATPDGRWTVRPVTMSGIGSRAMRREWRVDDTTGRRRLSRGGSFLVVPHVYDARDLIAYHLGEEAAAAMRQYGKRQIPRRRLPAH